MFNTLKHNLYISDVDTLLLKWNVSHYSLMVDISSLKVDTAENWAIRQLSTGKKWKLSLIAELDIDTDGEVFLNPHYERS